MGEVLHQVVPVVARSRLSELAHPDRCCVVITLLQHEAPLLVQRPFHGPIARIKYRVADHAQGHEGQEEAQDKDSQEDTETAVPHNHPLGSFSRLSCPLIIRCLLPCTLAGGLHLVPHVPPEDVLVVMQRVLPVDVMVEECAQIALQCLHRGEPRGAATTHLCPSGACIFKVGVLLARIRLLRRVCDMQHAGDARMRVDHPRPHSVEPERIQGHPGEEEPDGVRLQRDPVPVHGVAAGLHAPEDGDDEAQEHVAGDRRYDQDPAQETAHDAFGGARAAKRIPANGEHELQEDKDGDHDATDLPHLIV
mmetsp:Transcript_90932/g.253004  ORF Transcript_90932/g.253004 Transcript_90932/m.253004 type:complete len:307 (+) Transcript_90932:580-1500(+)